MKEYISFPGLGIEPFHIDRVAFTLFGRPVAWYGIIICIGIILAVTYAILRAKTEKIKSDDMIDLAFFLVIFGVIGARLYYVLFSLEDYIVTGHGFFGNLTATLKNIVSVWKGGIAIYGALIAGFITIVLFCRRKKISLLKMVDVVSPAVMIGQLIGRWGNFVNIEAYGAETALPWRMGILKSNFDNAAELGAWTSETYVHPTFLYESLWNLLGFIIANIIYKRKKYDGQIFFFYIGWYGFGRMIIEGLRTDSLMLGPVRISQLVGFVTFALGVALSILMSRLAKQAAAEAQDERLSVVEGENSISSFESEDTETTDDNSASEDEISKETNNEGEEDNHGENN